MSILLRMLQISDTAFPTGAFSHSMGLEAFADAGRLRSAEDLREIVALYLSSMATSDCVALRVSCGAEFGELLRTDQLLLATRLTRELRSASVGVGRRFLASVEALGVEDGRLLRFGEAVRASETPGNLAVCYGVAASALGFGEEEALLSFLYSSVASLVAAGQKLIPLGGSTAQRLLFELHGEMKRAASAGAGLGAEDMYAFAPEVDVRSMLHERQRTRLYIS